MAYRNSCEKRGAQLKLRIEQNVSSETGLIEFTVKVGTTKVGVLPLKHATETGRGVDSGEEE